MGGPEPGTVKKDPNEVELTVGRQTDSSKLATAILRFFDEGKKPYLSCIGADAIAAGVKAVAIANGETAPQGTLLVIYAAFQQKQFADRRTLQQVEMTAIKMIVGRQAVTI